MGVFIDKFNRRSIVFAYVLLYQETVATAESLVQKGVFRCGNLPHCISQLDLPATRKAQHGCFFDGEAGPRARLEDYRKDQLGQLRISGFANSNEGSYQSPWSSGREAPSL